MDMIKKIASELEVQAWQVEAAVKLIDEAIPYHLLPDTGKRQLEH